MWFRREGVFLALLLACAVAFPAGCAIPHVPGHRDGETDREQSDQSLWHTGSVPHLRLDVIEVLPHDRTAFTQGLELAEGILYEGTGQYEGSVMRTVDPSTGRTLREVPLAPDLFGEGITVSGDRIWQLTWHNNVALLRDRETLRELRRVHYAGEGWGLCHDGDRLVMSDGSSRLTFRDAATFTERGGVEVTLDGERVEDLNELECVGGEVFANVWETDRIVRIDPSSGRVTGVVDASGLLPADLAARADVLNGIAAVEGTDEFLLTGKYWPHVYRVRFVPV